MSEVLHITRADSRTCFRWLTSVLVNFHDMQKIMIFFHDFSRQCHVEHVKCHVSRVKCCVLCPVPCVLCPVSSVQCPVVHVSRCQVSNVKSSVTMSASQDGGECFAPPLPLQKGVPQVMIFSWFSCQCHVSRQVVTLWRCGGECFAPPLPLQKGVPQVVTTPLLDSDRITCYTGKFRVISGSKNVFSQK